MSGGQVDFSDLMDILLNKKKKKFKKVISHLSTSLLDFVEYD